MATFGQRLADEMRRADVSGRQLAAAVGVSQNTVSSWVCGRFHPSFGRVEAIAEALAIDPSRLRERSQDSPAAASDDLLEVLARAERAVAQLRRALERGDSA